MSEQNSNLISLTSEIVSAFVSRNQVRADELPRIIQATYDAMASAGLNDNPAVEQESFARAVTARKSLSSADHIISMIDGKPYTSLKRHLRSHGLTFEEYKARYNLPTSYPSVAPGYSEKRRALAHAIGLGRKGPAAPTRSK